MLVVDKPEGPTSHDVVDRVRRTLGQRRVGHTGTLDPFATGVLPLCIGKATRLSSYLAEGVKAYEAVVRLGFATTTDDVTGEALGPPRQVEVTREQVDAACQGFVGAIEQVPPAFSAKHVGGERLHALARRGASAERKPARVTVYVLEVRGLAGDRVAISVRCSSGTYIRAFARDLGEALDTGGHLVALRRTESSGFCLDGALAWGELAQEVSVRRRIVPLEALLPTIPAVRVGPEGRDAIRHGRDIEGWAWSVGEPGSSAERLRVLGADGSLLGLAKPVPGTGRLHPHVVLVD